MPSKNHKKAWIVAVDMGYGHQRTAFPLRHLAPNRTIINANNYQRMPESDRKIWQDSKSFYEFISDFKKFPILGGLAFSIFDQFQKIHPFYSQKKLEPPFQLKQIYFLIKKGWGKDLIEKLNKRPLSLITTFFVPAFMAEYHGYKGEIFCVVCDSDISRSWAPLFPTQSRIKYFAPNERVVERLALYGVRKENIFLTGYPLPKENIGSQKAEILKKDVGFKILNLDFRARYSKFYFPIVKKYIGGLPKKSDHALTLMFSVGGAGTQKEIAIKAAKSLKEKIKNKEIKLILSAGIRKKVRDYFLKNIEKLGLKKYLGENIEIIFEKNIENYFDKFNLKLRKTDILWTKPSELSFYAALGLPIIIAPPLGSQEDFNKEWLLKIGVGINQGNPEKTNDWLFEMLNSGLVAEAAIQGFIETEKFGVFNIEKIIK